MHLCPFNSFSKLGKVLDVIEHIINFMPNSSWLSIKKSNVSTSSKILLRLVDLLILWLPILTN